MAVGPGHHGNRHGRGLTSVNQPDPFSALGDQTRRQIVEMLAHGGPSTATGLAGELDISRQAVAKHLQLLSEAGLAASHRVGRETRFEATLDGLAGVHRWMETVEAQWHTRLARLAAAVQAEGEVQAEVEVQAEGEEGSEHPD